MRQILVPKFPHKENNTSLSELKYEWKRKNRLKFVKEKTEIVVLTILHNNE